MKQRYCGLFLILIFALSGCGDIRLRSDDVQSVLVSGISQYSKDKETADLATVPHAYFDAALFRELLPKFKKESGFMPPKQSYLTDITFSNGKKIRLLMAFPGHGFRILGDDYAYYKLNDPGRSLGYAGPDAARWEAELLRVMEAIRAGGDR